MSNLKTKLLFVQLGVIVLIGLTFNTVVTYSKTEIAQLTAMGAYALIAIGTYKMYDIWQFCQRNFKIAGGSSQKRTSH